MELFEYQKCVVDKCLNYFESTDNPKPFNIFFKMGLGKTIMALEIANKLNPRCLVIICPKSLITMWEYNITKHYKNKYVLVSKLSALNVDWQKTCIYITNYESLLNNNNFIAPDLLILDEAHKVKNTASKTHKQIAKYLKPGWTLTLTGTPIANNLMDLFGVLTCIGQQDFYGLTRTRYYYKYVLNGGTLSKDELITMIKPYTVMGDLEEFVDMPGYEDIIIPVPVSEAFLTEHNLRATNPYKLALARIIDCQRLTSGINEDGQLISDFKLKYCIDLINNLIDDGEKVVIFTKYKSEFDYLMKEFNGKCVGLNGDTKDRDYPVYEFQNNPNIKVFVGNLQAASLGLTLTAATKCIFYSETYDWAAADQARARIYRIGQNKFCTYYHLLCPDTIDELIFKNYTEKTDLICDFKKQFGGN